MSRYQPIPIAEVTVYRAKADISAAMERMPALRIMQVMDREPPSVLAEKPGSERPHKTDTPTHCSRGALQPTVPNVGSGNFQLGGPFVPHHMLISGLAAASLLVSTAAYAGTMVDGTYRCTIGTMHLGNIQIEGNSYAGPAHDGNYEATYSYDRTDGGTIDWGGPLGGISSGGNTILGTVVTDAGAGQQGFDVTLQNERGNFQTVSCAPE